MRRERGSALLVVLVLVLLASLLAMTALRSAWFSERIGGVEADHQRAFDNAQALLHDAELDLQRSVGSPAGCQRCRPAAAAALAAARPWVPTEGLTEFEALHAVLAANTPSCQEGLCVSTRLDAAFWQAAGGPRALEAMKSAAARHGQYSGQDSQVRGHNPLLATRAWYWIEILPYRDGVPASGTPEDLSPDASHPFVYRITALAEGHHPGTRVVLQSLVLSKRMAS